MPKEILLSSSSIDQMAHHIAEIVLATLHPAQPSPILGPDPEMPAHVKWITEARTTCLHAALQVAHSPQEGIEAAQRFMQFLQQGT